MTKKYTALVRYTWLLVAFAGIYLSAGAGLAESSDNTNPTPKVSVPPVSLHLPPLGLRLRDLSPAERADLKLDNGILVVVAVGAAAIAGVREDDIIVTVDKKPVTNAEQFWLLVDAKNWNCTLQIVRKDKRLDIAIGAK
jgi:S1-C subfamily serine protease